MERHFNSAGVCNPALHYMVNIENKLEQIKKLVDRKEYFVMNRPRQYGKTTTLFMLEEMLKEEYLVLSISFEGIGDDVFKDESKFAKEFLKILSKAVRFSDKNLSLSIKNQAKEVDSFGTLSDAVTDIVEESDKEVILLIDEVDKSSNNQLFLSFLGMLRNKYLARQVGKDLTFSSVVLAGVYDVKNLKLKIRPEEEKKYNSPWNISVKFNVDMCFSPEEIESMLLDYSKSRGIELETSEIAKLLYRYTEGYPFLVSRLCQMMDEEFDSLWTKEVIFKAIKSLIEEDNILFDDLVKNLDNHEAFKNYLFDVVMNGETKTFSVRNHFVNLGMIFGYLQNKEGRVAISNEIFKHVIYDYFATHLETAAIEMSRYNIKNNFVTPTGLDFEKILFRFQQFMKEQYSSKDENFIEREGRLLFLAFIKPIINGIGFDFKEVQVSEEKRLDVVVTYLKEKYVVELKIWRGPEYHQKGLKQLCDYLEIQGKNNGYLVIFDFNKNKEYKQETLWIGDKEIFIVWV